MPRKNKGVRRCHVKSRNGCVQCKRRRVKCDVKQPACSSCLRRNESCEYPDMFGNGYYQAVQAPWPDYISSRPANILHPTSTTEFELLQKLKSGIVPPGPNTRLRNDYTGLRVVSTGVIRLVMDRASITPDEVSLWSSSMASVCREKDYIMHIVMSLACGLQDVLSRPDKMVGELAYEHNIKASALFRERNELIDANNWLPPIMFHVLTVVFRFYSQAFCRKEDFGLVDTMRLFRSGSTIMKATTPYVKQSSFWSFIVERTALDKKLNTETEAFLHQSLRSIESALDLTDANPFSTEEQRYESRINRQALTGLYAWVEHCDAMPRCWPHYCGWPTFVPMGFLELLEQKNEVALLLVIHWCGVMYRSTKPGVKAWAYRAGHYSLEEIHHPELWREALEWPLKMLLPLW
ncbi:hypothetical protein DM02DRAFT_614235 [Periconia macrospinosa]|uniref:Zn(2)-C6 fungal-type domain-containing protein n=1 Tax=Periconia macrospinosa TaxID=97972 RepID=A0A2V1DRG0_9PLEO|nr:hypothetical protein DM02DRAFT_614235 [Periconia macrospinosa]